MKAINYENYYWQNDLVRLRAITPEDSEASYMNRFDSKARTMLQLSMELPPVAEKEKEAFERISNFNPVPSGKLFFTIETLEGIPVGGLNLSSIDERNGTFSIGMEINLSHRGKGYGSAAMRILLDYAFNERRLNKFNASFLEGNTGSMTMLKKLGAVQEGVRRQVVYTGGKYKDEILFGLTREEFNKNTKPLPSL
jgi:RimJ/RimL family protein N-acetyltransferase